MSAQHQTDNHGLSLPNGVSRRTLLLGSAGLLFGACSGSSDGGTVSAAPALTDLGEADGIAFMRPTFSDGLRGPSTIVSGIEQRAPLLLVEGGGLPVVNNLPDPLIVTLTSPSGTTEELSLPVLSDGIATPHYAIRWTPAETGEYNVATTVEGLEMGFPFVVMERDKVPLVQVGDPMRPLDTPTFADSMGFNPICTRLDPCPFHEVTLTEAIAASGPTVLLISTPGFCQTTSCGPVLELLIEEAPSIANLTVVHAEVYTEPGKLAEVPDPSSLFAPVIDTYSMAFEPSMVVADDSGIVTARLDYNWDRTEVIEALQTVG